ncbi:hypothetical protein [Bradyrhizobium sp.]|uniref:hypothetical protein n=1 Tax=Bradyrhizobium sp. TaxID=376 RepID=UPI00260FE382|nr:hypothetical protein [Bradyrhizobium sp.]
MNEMSQLASAMVTLIFAAGMLIAGQLYMDSRSAKASIIPVARPSSPQNPNREGLVTSVKTSHAFQSTQFRGRRQQ